MLQLHGYHLSAQLAVWPQSRAGAATGVSRARAASAAVAVEDLAACSFQKKRLWYLLWEENNPWLWRMSSREVTQMPFTFSWRLSFSCKNSWLLPFNFAGNLCSHWPHQRLQIRLIIFVFGPTALLTMMDEGKQTFFTC